MKQASMAPAAVYLNVGLIADDICDGHNRSGAAAEQREAEIESFLLTATGADTLEQHQQLHAQRSVATSASELTCAWTQLYPMPAALASIYSNDCCPVKAGPPGRTKHAACVHRSGLYVHGGRSGNVPLKDFWRFDFGSGSWTSIGSSNQSGDPPGHLESHTLVSSDGDDYRSSGDNNMGSLYIFGGELSFCSKNETSLWRYDIGTGLWTKCNPTGSSTCAPGGRRGHTAIVHRQKMHVFGGYMDFIGSTDELWTFDFVTSTWKLLHGHAGGSHVTEGRAPAGRHDHSALHCSSSMLVYGGMANLAPCYDLWQWSFNVHCWTKIHLSSLRRRAPKRLQLAVQVDRRVFLLSDGEENELISAEESRATLWHLNMSTGVMKKCKQASAKLTATTPAICQYSLTEIRSPPTCHSAPPWQEPSGLNLPESESINSAQMNEKLHWSFEAAGDISTAILHTLRNQVAPAASLTDMPTPRAGRGRDARHRMAFQNDLSIFSAFSTTRSTDCLLPPAASTRDALFGVRNPLRSFSDLSMSSFSGRAETVRELSNSSPSVKETVTSDYEQLALARLQCRGSACGGRTSSGEPLPSASGHSTPELPGSVWLPVTNSILATADDLRTTVQQVAASAAASTETTSEECSGHQKRPSSSKSESHTTAKTPFARPSPSYNCVTELYMVGGLPMDFRGTAALASAYEGRTKQLTVWRCCILNEN